MKRLLPILTMLLAGRALGSPYFRPLEPAHVHQSAALLIDPNGLQPSVAVTDIALVTHSTADGSIIPLAWRGLIPPEDWAPLELGGGGSLHAAVIHIGTSFNLAPQLGALGFKAVTDSSPVWLQALKAAIIAKDGQGVRLGGGLLGNIVKDGIVQSAKEAFPGRGLADIFKKSGRITVGYSWVWGK